MSLIWMIMTTTMMEEPMFSEDERRRAAVGVHAGVDELGV
jgi:hypothetical protein